MIRWVFWNAPERRLRAGWRIPLTLLITALVLSAAAFLLKATPAGPWRPIIGTITQVGLLVTLLFGVGAWIDRRTPRDYGFAGGTRCWSELALGLLLGGLLQSLIFLTLWLAGWAEVRPWVALDGGPTFRSGMLAAVMIAIGTGISEEALMRGYVFRNLAEGLNLPRIGPRAALLITWLATSVLFAAIHLGNQHMNALAFINLVLAGLLLGLPIILTGRIALAMGLHVAWNFVEGGVYGFAVSGHAPRASLLVTQLTGPPLLTGGDFGPEAGLVCTVTVFVGAAAICFAVVRRDPVPASTDHDRPARRLALAEDFATYAPRATPHAALESST